MKPFIVLLSTFAITLLYTKFFRSDWDFSFAGRLAMSVMLIFTASAHFAFSKGMAMMLPEIIPCKAGLVYLTGFIEIAAAIGLFIPSLQTLTGWLLIVFFIAILPANIYAAFRQIDYQKGTTDGNGLHYLWFRIPLQLLFIAWTYLSVLKK